MKSFRSILNELQEISEDVVPLDLTKARKPGSSMSMYSRYKNSDNLAQLFPKKTEEEPEHIDMSHISDEDVAKSFEDPTDNSNLILMAKKRGFMLTSHNKKYTSLNFLTPHVVHYKRRHVLITLDDTGFTDSITHQHWTNINDMLGTIEKVAVQRRRK